MRLWTLSLAAALALAGAAGCRKQDVRTVAVSVPGLTEAAVAQHIQDAFLKQPGIRSVRPDIERRTLTVTYDSMVTARKNIEFTIAEAGFEANDIPAKAAPQAPPPADAPPAAAPASGQ